MTATTPEKRPSVRMGEVALAMASRPHAEPTHKVKLNRSTANGRWGIEVEVASRDLDEAYAEAVAKARLLEQEFPYEANGAKSE